MNLFYHKKNKKKERKSLPASTTANASVFCVLPNISMLICASCHTCSITTQIYIILYYCIRVSHVSSTTWRGVHDNIVVVNSWGRRHSVDDASFSSPTPKATSTTVCWHQRYPAQHSITLSLDIRYLSHSTPKSYLLIAEQLFLQVLQIGRPKRIVISAFSWQQRCRKKKRGGGMKVEQAGMCVMKCRGSIQDVFNSYNRFLKQGPQLERRPLRGESAWLSKDLT